MSWARELTPDVTGSPTPAAGQAINDDLNTLWELRDAWDTWTPTGYDLTAGNGTWSGRYFDLQGRSHFQASFTFGTTSAVTATDFTVGFSGFLAASGVTSASVDGPGLAAFYDASASTWYHGTASPLLSGDTVFFYADGADILAGVPFTWTDGDVIVCQFDLRADGLASTMRIP